jgi:hypothetical protein
MEETKMIRRGSSIRFGSNLNVSKFRGERKKQEYADMLWKAILCTVNMYNVDTCKASLAFMGVEDESSWPKKSPKYQKFFQFRSSLRMTLRCLPEKTRVFILLLASRFIQEASEQSSGVNQMQTDHSSVLNAVSRTDDGSGALDPSRPEAAHAVGASLGNDEVCEDLLESEARAEEAEQSKEPLEGAHAAEDELLDGKENKEKADVDATEEAENSVNTLTQKQAGASITASSSVTHLNRVTMCELTSRVEQILRNGNHVGETYHSASPIKFAELLSSTQPECFDILVNAQLYETHALKGQDAIWASLTGFKPGFKQKLKQVTKYLNDEMTELKNDYESDFHELMKGVINFMELRHSVHLSNANENISTFVVPGDPDISPWWESLKNDVLQLMLKLNHLFQHESILTTFMYLPTCGTDRGESEMLLLAILVAKVSGRLREDIFTPLIEYHGDNGLKHGFKMFEPYRQLVEEALFRIRFQRQYDMHSQITEKAKELIKKHCSRITVKKTKSPLKRK